MCIRDRIRTDLKRFTIVVNAKQITAPTCQYERNGFQAGYIQVGPRQICLDCLAVPHRDLLGGIGGNALRSVWHKGVGKADFQNFFNKIHGINNFGIYDNLSLIHI